MFVILWFSGVDTGKRESGAIQGSGVSIRGMRGWTPTG